MVQSCDSRTRPWLLRYSLGEWPLRGEFSDHSSSAPLRTVVHTHTSEHCVTVESEGEAKNGPNECKSTSRRQSEFPVAIMPSFIYGRGRDVLLCSYSMLHGSWVSCSSVAGENVVDQQDILLT